MEMINSGMSANEAINKATGTYGRFEEGIKFINPREE